MNKKALNFSFVLVGMLALTATAYAFDFDKKFDVSVLKPVESKYKPVQQVVQEKMPSIVKQEVSTGFNYVSTSRHSTGNALEVDSRIDKYYDDEYGVVCYVSSGALQCFKAF